MNAPASVFEHNGTQYIAAYSAGNLFAGTTKGDSLWLFALNGTIDPVEPGTALTAAPAADGLADLDAGQIVYEAVCTFCHGEEGLGGHGGGPTLANVPSARRIAEIATVGQGDMPAFGGALTPEQLRDVGGFIIQRLLPAAQ
jgi:quinohemoprotein ethanol dehydrogenase